MNDLQEKKALIKSRNHKHTVYPIMYEGKIYWHLDELSKEKEIEGRNKAIREIMVMGVLSMTLVIFSLYKIAQFLMPTIQ